MSETLGAEHPAFPRASQWVVDDVYRGLQATDALCRALGVPYTIVAGTLLGAVRHGGMIPWDDDADIAVREEDFMVLADSESLVRNAGFGLVICAGTLKVYPLDGRRNAEPFRTPFVDIFAMRFAMR